jgi:hypothetical protein
VDIPATSDNIPGTLVLRDASGNVAATTFIGTATDISDGAVTAIKLDPSIKIGGATGGGTDRVFYENDQTVNTDYTLTASKNAMSAGPITVASGVTVTVPSGSTWTVI